MSADILNGLRAIVRGATDGPLQVDTVDRIPVEMLQHAVAEIAALRDQMPPAGLPATLASVDDVRRVCEAAGLDEYEDPHGDAAWAHGAVVVESADTSVIIVIDRVESSIKMSVGASAGPTELLWHAIQAALRAS